jgi:hypothetical protein
MKNKIKKGQSEIHITLLIVAGIVVIAMFIFGDSGNKNNQTVYEDTLKNSDKLVSSVVTTTNRQSNSEYNLKQEKANVPVLEKLSKAIDEGIIQTAGAAGVLSEKFEEMKEDVEQFSRDPSLFAGNMLNFQTPFAPNNNPEVFTTTKQCKTQDDLNEYLDIMKDQKVSADVKMKKLSEIINCSFSIVNTQFSKIEEKNN